MVDSYTFEELKEVPDKSVDEIMAETQKLIAESNDEMWRMQWDAVLNLRIVNKFHYSALEPKVAELGDFIRGQVENLRSNNSRNSLQLFEELFARNRDAHAESEGRK